MRIFVRIMLPLLLVAFLFFACDRNNTNPLQPVSGALRVLLSGPNHHNATRNDTLSYQAFVMNGDSSAATDGTPVRWMVTGRGQWVNPIAYSAGGVATNKYVLGLGGGIDTLIVLAGVSPNLATNTLPLLIEPIGATSSFLVTLTGPTHNPAITTDTLNYVAYVMKLDSTPARDNTPVHWMVTGHGQWVNSLSFTSNGYATGRYVMGNVSGTDTLIALAGTSPDIAMATFPLLVEPTSIIRLLARIRQIPPLLYATGRDSLEVYVTLRNQLNQGIENALITFSTRHGSIPASGITDASGTILTSLRDLGGADTTAPNGDHLLVRYPAANLIDSTLYYIRPLLNLDHINVNGPTEHVAYPGDTVSFTASVFLNNGNYCYDSTRVYWNCYKAGEPHEYPQNGIGQFLSPLTRTANGSTTNTFFMRVGVGIDSLVAISFTEGHVDTVKHWWLFEHIPGAPTRVWLLPRITSLVVNGPGVQINAIVRDTAYNLVPNCPFSWGCTNGGGTIEPYGYSMDGDTAHALLTPSSFSGQFRFWGTTVNNATDTGSFVVSGNSPSSISLGSDLTMLQVRSSGSNEITTLHAIVRDGFGNLVTGSRVLFKVMNSLSFDDPTHNPANHPYFEAIGVDSAYSTSNSNGEAVATLCAGIRPGQVYISAWVVDAGGNHTAITASLSSIRIVGGPPVTMTTSVSGNNATQLGGGLWALPVSTILHDVNGNPAADGFSVTFRVIPDSLAQTGPDTASSHFGIANNMLLYNGVHTFDTVQVAANCVTRDAGGNVVTLSDYTPRFALPLQQGTIQLNVSPSSIQFHPAGGPYPTAVNYAVHQIWATVRDGYGTSIHGAPCLFSVQRGRIFKTLAEASTQPPAYVPAIRLDGSQVLVGTTVYWPVSYRKTGNYTVTTNPAFNWTDPHGNGAATLFIGALGPCLSFNNGVGDIFLDPQSAETTSEVTVYIEGYPTVQSARFVINYSRI